MTQPEVIERTRKNLLIYSQRHGISQACKVFGVSRTTFYKIKQQYMKTGELTPRVRRKPKMPNETSLHKKKLLLKLVEEHPGWGLNHYVNGFREQGIDFNRITIWKCLKRFGLNTKYKRLIHIEELKLRNQPCTERTLQAVRRYAQRIKRGLWPGHIVALDTFFVGHLKGVGRIYQITGLDLCSRYGWAQLYISKEASSTINFVEQHLIPKFFNNGVELQTILTDNGSEFVNCGFKKTLHDYEITHYRITKGCPMLNGYCERFQRIILEEFYAPAFRRTFFKTLQELQDALNQYLVFYNFKRLHFGLIKSGALPIDAFRSKNAILRHRFQKLLT